MRRGLPRFAADQTLAVIPHPKARPWPADHEPTPFQAEVMVAMRALAPGDLVTYADVADQLGRPGSAQAVANVLRGAPDLPWWRVVPGGGRVYRSHRHVQIELLRDEGHDVDDEGRIRA